MQDLLVRFLVRYLLLLISLISHAHAQVDNNAPIVKIIKPMASEPLHWNTLVPYAVSVNDIEDGNTAYEEIADREVILIVKYLEDLSLVNNYIAGIDRDLVPLMAMSKSTCLNCHAASNKFIGPSFDLIAKKYSTVENAKSYLTEKVAAGGTGIWGEEKMPPNPGLTKAEINLMVDWILKQKDHPSPFYVGLSGAIRTKEAPSKAGKGGYVLTAAYEDHGLALFPKNRKIGRETIIVLPKP